MAQVKDNIITLGLSGKFANQIVFRQRDGKTIVSRMPQMPDKRSKAQTQQSNKFREAVKYAQYILQTPSLLSTYAERAGKGKTPYNLAISDYLKPPVMGDIKWINEGNINRILIQASDDHLITEVFVKLYDTKGILLEQGQARNMENQNEWAHELKNKVSELSGHTLHVRITDLPANSVEKEFSLP